MTEREHEQNRRVAMDAVVKFALEAIRLAILMNGAAASGLVAFLPNSDGLLDPGAVAWAITYFGIGAFLGACGAGMAYVAQAANLEHETKGWRFQLPRAMGVAAVFTAYLVFILGALSAAASLPNTPTI